MWKWILIALAAILFFWFALTAIVFFGALRRQKRPPKKEALDLSKLLSSIVQFLPMIESCKEAYRAQEKETVTITADDGIPLYADIMTPECPPIGTVLMMHGYRSSAESDFATAYSFYLERGYRVVLPDQRACGRSGGKYITLGVKERLDCRRWIDKINELYGTKSPIVLDGLSMGATTVLMTAALSLPENVVAIVADCGFTSPDAIMRAVMKQTHALPAFPCVPIAALYARLFAGFSLKEASTVDALRVCSVPVFLIHGKADRFVPYAMSEQNFEACASEKEFFSVDGAEHGMSFLIDHETYAAKLDAFLRRAQERIKKAND